MTVDKLPTRIKLESTTACQLRCPLCPTASGEVGRSLGTKNLKFENFKKFLDENSYVKEVELSNWGELFLNPEIIDIIKYAHSKSVLLTADNGSNLNTVSDEVLEALVLYKFKSITCSIDGVSQEVYSKYRVRGNVERVFENIKKINHFKKIHKTPYPYLLWQYVAFGHNEHEILEAKKKARKLNMTFHLKLNYDESFSPVKNKDLVKKLSGLDVSSRSEYKKKYNKAHNSGLCYQLWNNPQINSDGRLLGCCINYWGDFGNAFQTPLADLMNSSNYQYARSMLMGQVKEKEGIPCSSCSIYKERKLAGHWISPKDFMPPSLSTRIYRKVKRLFKRFF